MYSEEVSRSQLCKESFVEESREILANGRVKSLNVARETLSSQTFPTGAHKHIAINVHFHTQTCACMHAHRHKGWLP